MTHLWITTALFPYQTQAQNLSLGQLLKTNRDSFPPNPFQFIIRYHPVTQRYILRTSDSIVK